MTINQLSKKVLIKSNHQLKKTVFIKTTRGRKNPSINQILKIEISMVTKTMIIFIIETTEIGIKNLITSLMEL